MYVFYSNSLNKGVDKGAGGGWRPSRNVGRGPTALGLGARAAMQRANLGLTETTV